MSVQNYCSDLPGDFTNNRCVNEEGGIIAVGFMDKDAYATWTDFEDNTEWAAAIVSGDVKPILYTRGSYAGPEWQEADGYGEVQTIITGATHTVNYRHLNLNEELAGVAVNYDFYNKLAKVPGQYHFYIVTQNYDLLIWDKPATVKPGPNIPESTTEFQEWIVEVVMQSINLPARYDAPASTYSA